MKYAPYSFSKINVFFDCPKKFDFTYINKIKKDEFHEEPPYFIRGRFIHNYIANRLSGGDGLLNSKYGSVDAEDKMNLVEAADNALENPYVAMSYEFEVTEIEKQIWLGSNLKSSGKLGAAMKGYIDYYAVQDDFGMIIDWKTGRYRENPSYSQLEMYAIWLMSKYKEVDEVDLMFYYIEHDNFSVKTVTREEIDDLKYNLVERISIIEEETEFAPNPETKKCNACEFFGTCLEKYEILGLDNF